MTGIPPTPDYRDVVSIEIEGLTGADAKRCAETMVRAAQAYDLPLTAVTTWPSRRVSITGEVTPAVVAHFEPFTDQAAITEITQDIKEAFPGHQVWVSCKV